MTPFASTWDGRATASTPTRSDEACGRNFGKPDNAVQHPNGADAPSCPCDPVASARGSFGPLGVSAERLRHLEITHESVDSPTALGLGNLPCRQRRRES